MVNRLTGDAPKHSWDNWGHSSSATPSDWEDVKEYIEGLAKWAEYRKKYPKAFEIIDGRGKGIYHNDPERKNGRPPKMENKSTGATPIVDGKVQYTMQPNGVEVAYINGYLWPRETIEAVQNGTFMDYSYRGAPTIWERWEQHASFSLT